MTPLQSVNTLATNTIPMTGCIIQVAIDQHILTVVVLELTGTQLEALMLETWQTCGFDDAVYLSATQSPSCHAQSSWISLGQ